MQTGMRLIKSVILKTINDFTVMTGSQPFHTAESNCDDFGHAMS